MVETDQPGTEKAADELEAALKKAAQAGRNPENNEIAADDAGGSALAEEPSTPKR